MLTTVLRLNAASCIGFGLLFLAAPGATAAFVGSAPAWLVAVLGAGLVVNGLHILWAARRGAPSRRDVLYFAVGDAAWVIATAALILGGLWITTSTGIAWAIAVALWVGACGFAQWRLAPAA